MIILIFSLLFVGLVLLFGGNAMAKSLVTLTTNLLLFFLTLLAIYLGAHPTLATIVGCIIIALITLFFQNGINIKTRVAFVCVLGIILFSLVFILFFSYYANIQGFPVGQFAIRPSNGYFETIQTNMMILQIGVILVVLIGSCIDTAFAVASATYEVYRNNPHLDMKELFYSAFNVGKDIVSSTVNTLFFIFLGEYFTLFILFINEYSFGEMINHKAFAQEVITITVAAFASVAIIPLTALWCSLYYPKKKRQILGDSEGYRTKIVDG